MAPLSNPAIRVHVQVLELENRLRLVAVATFESGTSGDKLIDSQDDLSRFAADHGCLREDVVFKAGADALLTELPQD